jgi:hypothetical protein
MKRSNLLWCTGLLVLTLCVTVLPVASANTPVVSVFVDGVQLAFPDQQPVLQNGRTLVPVRYVSETFGAWVGWVESTRSVPIVLGDKTITLHIGQKTVRINDATVTLDVAPMLYKGRTLVPLRFISEVLGAEVVWSEENHAVFINRSNSGQSPVAAHELHTYRNTYLSQDYLELALLSNGVLNIKGSTLSENKWVWLRIVDATGSVVGNAHPAIQDDGSYEGSVSINLSHGDYIVEVFMGKEYYGTYQSYDTNIPLKNTPDGPIFPVSPVYSNNVTRHLQTSRELVGLSVLDMANKTEEQTLRALAQQITDGANGDYDKVRRINDWVAQNIYYDMDSFRSGQYGRVDAYGTYQSKRSVCQGYAELTTALLRAVGIPSRVVTGYALGVSASGSTWNEVDHRTANHAWNEAYADGRWVIFDTAWNSGNKYENGKFHPGDMSHRFFDMTLEALSLTHKIMN